MDAVLRNFKSIPCPAGDACTTQGCQWQHSWDINTSSVEHDGVQGDEGPRKRQKVSPSLSAKKPLTPSSPANTGSLDSLKRKAYSPVPTQDQQPRKVPKTSSDSGGAGHPIQSKSLAVKAATDKGSALSKSSSPSSIPSAKAGAQPTSSSSTAGTLTPPRPPASSPLSSPKPRKPESLNPRHLKSAPSTHEFRHKVLKLLHDQFVRLNNEAKKLVGDDKAKAGKVLRSPQELIWCALDEEERVALDRPTIYNNMIKNRIMDFKKMKVEAWLAEQEKDYESKRPKRASQGQPEKAKVGTDAGGGENKLAATPSAPQLGSAVVVRTGLRPEEEVQVLRRLMTPVAKLTQHGYVAVAPTEEEIARAREGEEASKGYEICDRCKARFQVFPGRREEDGALASGGKCTHHYGKAYSSERAPGERGQTTRKLRCCGEAVGDSPGCYKADTHVFKVTSAARLASVLPFVETPPNPKVPKDRAVAFDCEMAYTVRGMELIRLTVTNWPDGRLLLDVLVRPVGEILDLNSRYSGVWAQDIINAKPYSGNPAAAWDDGSGSGVSDPPETAKQLEIVTSPAAARDLFFSLIAPTTPLVGHGLENDLNAVRIVHPAIVDTVVLYPHPRGLPLRNGLKALMERHLNKRIQLEVDAEGKTVMGHDSAEDARAAGELVLLAVSREWDRMKREGWALVDGVFVPPGAASKTGDGGLTEGYLEEEEEQEKKKQQLAIDS